MEHVKETTSYEVMCHIVIIFICSLCFLLQSFICSHLIVFVYYNVCFYVIK